MKFKDYYQVLGLERTATAAEIKTAYRKLAHKFHPDVSKDPAGEAKFKEIAEAYATLKDPEKRAEYDQLGQRRPGENFEPPRDWQNQFHESASAFDDVDLADLLAAGQVGPLARQLMRWALSQRRPWTHVFLETLRSFAPPVPRAAGMFPGRVRRPAAWGL